jgi:hypothetical protein
MAYPWQKEALMKRLIVTLIVAFREPAYRLDGEDTGLNALHGNLAGRLPAGAGRYHE